MGWPYGEDESMAIRQLWLCCCYACTKGFQVTIELSVVEGAKLYSHSSCFLCDPSAEPKEGGKSMPGCMSIGCREVVITDPCKFQSTREREMSLNRQDQVVLSAKYFNGSAKKAHIFSVTAK